MKNDLISREFLLKEIRECKPETVDEVKKLIVHIPEALDYDSIWNDAIKMEKKINQNRYYSANLAILDAQGLIETIRAAAKHPPGYKYWRLCQ